MEAKHSYGSKALYGKKHSTEKAIYGRKRTSCGKKTQGYGFLYAV
ncbi:hypothetical protein F240042I4_39140 [Eisenbergiella tayi]